MFEEIADAKLAVIAAGVLIVGVVVAQRAIFWIQCVLIVRQADREQQEWESERT